MTRKYLEDLVKREPMVLIFFWKRNNKRCGIVAKSVSAVKKVFEDTYFIKIDCDRYHDIMAGCGIKELPTVMLFGNGRIFVKITGVPSALMLTIDLLMVLKSNVKENKKRAKREQKKDAGK